MAGVPVAGASTLPFARDRESSVSEVQATPTSATDYLEPVTAAPAPSEPAPSEAPAAATVAPVEATVVAPTPESTVAELPAGVEATVTIASLGINLPIIAGGQSVIDQGVVAHYSAPGWEEPVSAGSVGTYWLAAHRETHGGPFRSLPDVAVGAEIRVTTDQHTYVYTVTSIEVTGLYPGDAAVYGTDPTASVILLQTCIDSTLRVLVHGTLTATL